MLGDNGRYMSMRRVMGDDKIIIQMDMTHMHNKLLFADLL